MNDDTTKAETMRTVVGGVDTHRDTHTAAAVDDSGRNLGTETFPATTEGYRTLLGWLQGFGTIRSIGIEGTGSYGAWLARFLTAAGETILEVNRPNRQDRRRHGKSDPADAVSAALSTLSGRAAGTPKSHDGPVEVMRLVRAQRRSAIKARTQAANQIHAVLSSAPEELRTQFKTNGVGAIVKRALRFRRVSCASITEATRRVLRGLESRWTLLDREVDDLDDQLDDLVRTAAPDLVALKGVGAEVASALLVAVGDNPARLANEPSFAALCGVSPVDASSGRQHRHSLNRGGNRDANRALWVIAFVRIRCDERTQLYMQRRTSEGLSKMEILRCLKRYIAREVFGILKVLATSGKDLRSTPIAA